MSHPTSAVALSIRDAAKKFGPKPALAGVSLSLGAGECLGLLGPNGAGKTTLVRSIVGRVSLDAGSVDVLGAAVGTPAARAALGYVPQEIALYPLLTARENLAVFGRYLGMSSAHLPPAIAWCLEWAALADRADDVVKTFSGGMKRRLNMAAGLLHHPPIVLLDEPTVGVDPQSRERIYGMIEQLRREGTSLIYTTHYMEEAERLCDRIAIIDHGRIIALGARDQLIRSAFGSAAEVAIHLGAADGAAADWAARFRGRLEGACARFSVASAAVELAAILEAARLAGLSVEDLTLKRPNLESLFLKLTGRELRE